MEAGYSCERMNAELDQLAIDYQTSSDSRDFTRLHDALRPKLKGLARYYRPQGYGSDDLMQIAMIQIWRKIGKYDRGSFKAFARKVARRRLVTLCRERLRPKHTNETGGHYVERHVYDHPLWNIIIEEEKVLQNQRRLDRPSGLSEKQVENREYRDQYALKRELFDLRPPRRTNGPQRKRRPNSPYKQKIQRLDTKQVFDDIYEAAQVSRASKRSLLNAAKHGYTCAKTKWRLVR
jgi:RNA polymerase sigma factor (sigma-70 family)